MQMTKKIKFAECEILRLQAVKIYYLLDTRNVGENMMLLLKIFIQNAQKAREIAKDTH